MNLLPERRLRFTSPGERRAETHQHWAAGSPAERLQATLALHREGNNLFKGGHPGFVFQWKLRHVIAR